MSIHLSHKLHILLRHVCIYWFLMYHQSSPSPYFMSFMEILQIHLFPEPAQSIMGISLDKRKSLSLNYGH